MKNLITYLSVLFSIAQAEACISARSSSPKVTTVWKFPLGYWVENLVVRDQGEILTTIATHPQVYQIDPTGTRPAMLAATIPDHLGVLGIAKGSTDKFYVGASNISFPTNDLAPHTCSIYELDLSKFDGKAPVRPKFVARFRKAGLLSGIVSLDAAKGLLLIADSTKGAVWRLNVHTGEKKKLMSDPLMKKTSFIGINGVKIAGGHLYWTNTDRQFVARAPISASGAATGPGQIVANVTQPDDFILGSYAGVVHGANGFVAGHDMVQVFHGDEATTRDARKLLAGSTAVTFAPPTPGSGCRDLYVSTSGDDAQYGQGMKITKPGRLVRVHC